MFWYPLYAAVLWIGVGIIVFAFGTHLTRPAAGAVATQMWYAAGLKLDLPVLRGDLARIGRLGGSFCLQRPLEMVLKNQSGRRHP